MLAEVNRTAREVNLVIGADEESRQAVYNDWRGRAHAENCAQDWLKGRLAHSLERWEDRNSYWERVIPCQPVYLVLMQLAAQDDRLLAEKAVELRPELASTWYWLAEVNTKSDSEQAVQFLRTGLALDTQNGLRWRELGDLLNEQDPEAAIQAYLQSCFNGDPGANGCYRAGLTAERIGDFGSAIKYYRLSRWAGSWAKAEALEQRLGLP